MSESLNNTQARGGERVQVRLRDNVKTEEDLLALHEAFMHEQVKPAAQARRVAKGVPIKVPAPYVDDYELVKDNDDNDDDDMPPLVPASVQPQAIPDVKESNATHTSVSSTDQAVPRMRSQNKRGPSLFAQRQAALLERVRSMSGDPEPAQRVDSAPNKGAVLAGIKERLLSPTEQQQQAPPKVVPLSTITGFPEPELLPASIESFTRNLTSSTNPIYAEIDRENREILAAMPEDQIEQEIAELQERLGKSGLAWMEKRLAQRLSNEQESDNRDKYADQIVSALKPGGGTCSSSTVASTNTSMNETVHDDSVEIVGEIGTTNSVNNSNTSKTSPPLLEEAEDPITLRERYFRDVPLEPEKLAWMGIINKGGKLDTLNDDTSTNRSNNNNDDTSTAEDKVLTRYDLRGQPIQANADIPIHHGLHHHGKEQDKAGYTIEELLLLARSAVAAQRATAWRILSRILWLSHETNDDTAESSDGRWSDELRNEAILQFAELSGPMYLALGLEESHTTTIAHIVDALDAWCNADGPEKIDDSSTASQTRSNLNEKGRLRVLAALDIIPRLQYAKRQGRPTEKTLAQIDQLITRFTKK